ncbi:MAG: putative metal-dependent phosphoesterase TrpH, partial [Crocinitomicaceae bacterium]
MSSFIQKNEEKNFRQDLQSEFKGFLNEQSRRFHPDNCLQIDFHCHDHNSDIPDELWGRILRLPETWLKTKNLVKTLKENGSDVITITNHNNARSCWKLQDQGHDVLVGSEFTCFFPEYDLFVHVLTYGFTKEQEVILNDKRHNIYDFLRYTHSINVPVILPHPLYFYTRNEKIDISLFEK